MSITDELRKWAEEFWEFAYSKFDDQSNLIAIADRIDAEHQKAIRELNNLAEASVLLPVDADGERWHIGDRTESGQTVEAMGLNRYGWHFVGTINEIDPAIHRHHHAPTVEDVLREFGKAWVEWEDGAAMMNPVETFAAKLRLAEGEDA